MSSARRTIWEEGRAPGREVAALFVAILLTVVALEMLWSGGPGLLFDLTFVGLSVGAALFVRPADFFTIGVLPPLVMLGAVGLLAVADPGAVAQPQDGVVQATVSGLSRHAVALVVGYVLCLGVLGVRKQVHRGTPGAQPGSTGGRRGERPQTGAVAGRGRDGGLGARSSGRNAATTPGWSRSAGGRRRIQAQDQPNRSGSPAPRRSTSG